MQQNHDLFPVWKWRKIITISMIIIFAIFVTRMIYSIYITNMLFNTASNMIAAQESQMDKLSFDSKLEANDIQREIKVGIRSMKENAEKLDNNFTTFERDFSESLQAEYDRIDRRRRITDIRNFLDQHFRYYDQALYEQDRKKFIATTHYDVPNYAKYNELRDAVIKCHMDDHNQRAERNYRNHIAQLKAEHDSKLIQSVKRPVYWQWPLSKDQIDSISVGYLTPFDFITLEGKCRLD